jgi:hypothetical protein
MTLQNLYDGINECFNVDISSKKRNGNYPFYRKYYCLLAKIYTRNYNFTEIGSLINRDHSTVTAAINKLCDIMEFDKFIALDFEKAERFILDKYPYIEKLQQSEPDRNYTNFKSVVIIEQLKKDLRYSNNALGRYKRKYNKLINLN